MAQSSKTITEKAASGTWFIKEVDGFLYVKVNNTRVKTKVGHLTEDILGISGLRNGDDVLVSHLFII